MFLLSPGKSLRVEMSGLRKHFQFKWIDCYVIIIEQLHSKGSDRCFSSTMDESRFRSIAFPFFSRSPELHSIFTSLFQILRIPPHSQLLHASAVGKSFRQFSFQLFQQEHSLSHIFQMSLPN